MGLFAVPVAGPTRATHSRFGPQYADSFGTPTSSKRSGRARRSELRRHTRAEFAFGAVATLPEAICLGAGS